MHCNEFENHAWINISGVVFILCSGSECVWKEEIKPDYTVEDVNITKTKSIKSGSSVKSHHSCSPDGLMFYFSFLQKCSNSIRLHILGVHKLVLYISGTYYFR